MSYILYMTSLPIFNTNYPCVCRKQNKKCIMYSHLQATNRLHPRHLHPLHHLLNAIPPPVSHSTRHHLDPTASRRRNRNPSTETIKPPTNSSKRLFRPSTTSPRRRRLLLAPLIAHEGSSAGTGRPHPGPVSLQRLASVVGPDSGLYCLH